jgi:hypothetical protein
LTRTNCCTTQVITWTPFQLSTDFLVISVYLLGAEEQMTLVNDNNDDGR